MNELKIGQTVEILSDSSSVNKKGDVGVITEISKHGNYRVKVEGRKQIANWHVARQLKVVE